MLGYMPKFVLGGLLIYLGADQLYKWIVLSRHRLSIPEYLSLLAIIFIIVQWGFIAGVLSHRLRDLRAERLAHRGDQIRVRRN
jgi:SulP family sulfate permease